ncbi:MAG: hypothetical protein HZY74_08920 [Brevundimonas sp.]|nr:MAG: hypothetical protein HZY74_08920 [Brevundimonas sp.]
MCKVGRLGILTSGGVATDWLWDGDRLVAEYNAGGTLTARYLQGTGPDEPLAQIAGTRRWLLGDTQGSIIAETDTAGALVGNAITYDPMASPPAGPAPGSATPARCA